MNTATDTNPTTPLVWVAECDSITWRAKTTAGVYRVQKHPRGGYVTSFETEGGVIRHLGIDLGHVGRHEAHRVPGLTEAQGMAQIHANDRPHATVVPLENTVGIKHTFWPGDGVTWGYGSDRYPGTVVKVSKTSVWVRRDKAVRTDSNGMSEDQAYRFARNEDRELERFTVRKDQQVRRAGCKNYATLSHGRSAHYDPSF